MAVDIDGVGGVVNDDPAVVGEALFLTNLNKCTLLAYYGCKYYFNYLQFSSFIDMSNIIVIDSGGAVENATAIVTNNYRNV